MSGGRESRAQGEAALNLAMAIARDQGAIMYEMHAACDLWRLQNDAASGESAFEHRIDPMALARAAGIDRVGLAQIARLLE